MNWQGNDGDNRGPWGPRPSGGGSGGGGFSGWPGGGPPDFSALLGKFFQRIRRLVPKGWGGGRLFVILGAAVVAFWLFSGLYRVEADQRGVELVFGKVTSVTGPGLRWRWPFPVGNVARPRVENIEQINIGFVERSLRGRATTKEDVSEESLMLTGDQNIIDIDLSVQWKISDPVAFLFNVRNPQFTAKLAAESGIREIIGRTDIQFALTEGRAQIENDTKVFLQNQLNEYGAGIEITEVKLQDVQPPGSVIEAFNDVQRSLQDQDRQRNLAEAYRNDVLPRARGDSKALVEQARAYRERLVNEAEGEGKRFLEVYGAYRENPVLVRRRMYIEAMEEILEKNDKVLLDGGKGGGSGIVPYLPLDRLRNSPTP